MLWVCNAFPHAVDIVLVQLPGSYYAYTIGPPRIYCGQIATDPVISQIIGIYLTTAVKKKQIMACRV